MTIKIVGNQHKPGLEAIASERLPVAQGRDYATWNLESEGAEIEVNLNRRTGRVTAVELLYDETVQDWRTGIEFSEAEARSIFRRHRLLVTT